MALKLALSSGETNGAIPCTDMDWGNSQTFEKAVHFDFDSFAFSGSMDLSATCSRPNYEGAVSLLTLPR